MQGVDDKIKENKRLRKRHSNWIKHSLLKKRVDVDTKVPTRNYLDRVYLNTVDKVHAMGDARNESKRVGFHTPEKPSGSGDKPNYTEDTSRTRGRPSENFKLMMEQVTPQDQ